ncbi:MAG: response regulator [bacterium]|nr:response regulator [bacterium]
MAEHILIVEDEEKIARVLKDYLERAGYSVRCLESGDGVVAAVRTDPPALILLDLMLPGMDGMEICRAVRAFSSVPIIMATARVDEVDRVVGLEIGADDYVCKPFSPREVVARVQAVLRRAGRRQEGSSRLEVGPITADLDEHWATVNGEPLELTTSEFDLLATLLGRPNRVFSRAELLARVQGHTHDGYDRTIDTHVKNLRRKLRKPLGEQEVIVTVYGVGYKLKEIGRSQ